MFGGSFGASSSFFAHQTGSTDRRSSLETSLPWSQSSTPDGSQGSASGTQSGGGRSSTGDRRASVGGRGMAQLDLPFRPATIQMIFQGDHPDSHLPSPLFDRSSEKGPVSLVGWPVNVETARFSPGESDFKLCDGTGIITVHVDIHSENESWLLARIKRLVFPERAEKENVKPLSSDRFHYLRVVGTVSWDDTPKTLRCLHVRLAEKEEAAFHHTLQCVWTVLKCVEPNALKKHDENASLETTVAVLDDKGSNYSGTAEHAAEECHANSAAMDLSQVELPDTFSACDDAYQLTILKYIMKFRKPEIGVNVTEMRQALSLPDAERFEQSLHDLQHEMAFCMDTVEGFMDVVIDGDEDGVATMA